MVFRTAIGIIVSVLVLCGNLYGASRDFYSNTFDTADSINEFVIIGEKFITYNPPPLHEVRVDSGQVMIETDVLRPNGPGTPPALIGRASVMMDAGLVDGPGVYNPILGKNTGVVSWSVNLSNQDGDLNNSFSLVLACSKQNPYELDAEGYAFKGGGYVGNKMILLRFGNGLGGGQTYLVNITDGLGPLPEKGSFRITYNPTTHEWALYGIMGDEYVNPENVNSLLGMGIDNTYSYTDTPYFGVIGSTTELNYFDNIKISVDDITPPSIRTHSPIDAANDVAASAVIRVEFLEPMNPTTVNASSILVSDGINDIEGVVTYQDNTAIFTPAVQMNCSTTYVVNVLTQVEDLFGNPLPENFSWSFTTSGDRECGCGVEGDDSDGDGLLDCNDGCPLDQEKTVPGACGCGLPETDTDGDTIEDCIDDDDDNDGVPDEIDAFPSNASESIDTDSDGIGNNADSDDDGDSIPDIVEDSGPNNGDSNLDGTPDRIQGHIISILSGDAVNYLALELPLWKQFVSCSIEETPSAQAAPDGYNFPHGFVRFVISGVQMDEVVPVVLHLPDDYRPDTYFKYGKTPDNQIEHWYEFLFDGQTGAEISENQVTLYFQDGQRGDDILALDGMIYDIGGPGSIDLVTQDSPIPGGGGGGGGGCFLSSLLGD